MRSWYSGGLLELIMPKELQEAMGGEQQLGSIVALIQTKAMIEKMVSWDHQGWAVGGQ